MNFVTLSRDFIKKVEQGPAKRGLWGILPPHPLAPSHANHVQPKMKSTSMGSASKGGDVKFTNPPKKSSTLAQFLFKSLLSSHKIHSAPELSSKLMAKYDHVNAVTNENFEKYGSFSVLLQIMFCIIFYVI